MDSGFFAVGGVACIVLLVLAGVILVVGLWFVVTYNGLVRLRNAVKNAWSQIDVQLKRRYDLIPNIVETVKGYASHERETLENVIKARQAGIDASTVKDQAAAENMITGALRQLFALSEAYPNLKANENFMALQEELASTENKISFARQYYNDTVQTFNTRQEMFPANLVASMLGFQPAEFFEIEDTAAREAPKVKF
jgi:LemA protein